MSTPDAGGSTEARRNIELKASDMDPERAAATCGTLGARAAGLLIQRDTYFHTSQGRLKLREETGGASHLIAYERPNRAGSRESRYRIVMVERGEELLDALSASLGVMAVIAKERRLFIWEGVRIHLDRVAGLGNFIELEAIAPAGSDLSHEEAQIENLRRAFEIEDADLIEGSYCDLALEELP